MKKFNITVVYSDGTSSCITNRLAENEIDAIINEVKNHDVGLKSNDKIVSITVIERVYKYE